MTLTHEQRRDLAFSTVVALLCALLALAPIGFRSPFQQPVQRPTGTVKDVDNSGLVTHGIVRVGSQEMTVRIDDGPYAGREVHATNELLGKLQMDKLFRPGDRAFLVLYTDGDRVVSATAYDHYRLNIQVLLLALFALLLVGFAGWTGIKAFLSLVFAVLLIWRVLVPAMLRGSDPIVVAVLVVAALTTVTLTLVAGVNRTAVVAIAGAFLGLLVTMVLSFILYPPFKLHGAVQNYAETLLYSGFPSLDLDRMFLAAIMIGACGAVMDLAIDVAAAQNEVVQKRPDLSTWEAVRSGFAVGRAMTSTMVTTLLMAYVAGYMALLMLFMGQGIPPVNILNTNYVAAEILRTMVGSFGLVTVAPFTAIVGGFVFVHWRSVHELKRAIEPSTALSSGGK